MTSTTPDRAAAARGFTASPATRWALGALLATWAVAVAIAFQANHPLPLAAWNTALSNMDWSLLVPSPSRIVAALGHLLAAATILTAAGGIGARTIGVLWGVPRGADDAPAVGPLAGFAAATSRGERAAMATACGLAVLALIAIGLAAVGGLSSQALWAVLAAGVGSGAPALWRLLRAAPTGAPAPDGLAGVRRVALVALGIGFLGTLPRALSPLVLFDSHVYHLALPQAYLEAHRFVRFPHMVFANAPHSMAVVYAYALSLGGPQTAKLLHGACGLGMVALTLGLGRRIAGPTAAVLAALLTLGTPLMLEHVATSYTDLALGFAFLAAVWATWYGLQSDHAGGFRVAGLLLGFYAGIKYTALFGVVGVGVALGLVLLHRRAAVRDWARVCVPYAIGLGVGAGPWLVKNAVYVGNPVFPMATGIFGLGPRLPSEPLRTQLVVAQHGMGHAPLDLLLLPWRITAHGDYGSPTFDGIILPIWLMGLPLLLLARRPWPPGVGFLGLVALAFFVAWAPVVHITRYLIPIFPLLSLLFVWAAMRVLLPEHDGRRRALLAWAGVLGSAFWWLPPLLTRVIWGITAFGPVAWGQVPPDRFIAREEQTAPVFAYMAEHLPEDARVLGLWENRRFRSPRPLEADGVFWTSYWIDRFAAVTDLPAFAAELRARGLTHVLYNAPFQRRFMPLTAGPEDEALVQRGLAQMHAFLAGHCDPIFEERGLHLYRIRAGPGAPG